MKRRRLSTLHDFYKILQVEPEADEIKIRKAYRRAALMTHPDKVGGCNDAFQRMTLAFNVLSCPTQRQTYDELRSSRYDYHCNEELRKAAKRTAKGSAARHRRRVQAGLVQTHPCKTLESCMTGRAKPYKGRAKILSRLQGSLFTLRCVLRDMCATQRRDTMSHMKPRIQKLLLAFMETCNQHGLKGDQSEIRRRQSKQLSTTRRCSHPHRGVWMVKGNKTTRYKARLNYDSVCISCRWERDVAVAAKQQVFLFQLREAFAASAIIAPLTAAKVGDIYACTLADNNIATSDIGLNAYVSLRGFGCRVESQAMTLENAWRVRAKLADAREVSWEKFRQMWIDLLCARKYRAVADEAAAFVDSVRSQVLSQRFTHAMYSVECVLSSRSESFVSRALNNGDDGQ